MNEFRNQLTGTDPAGTFVRPDQRVQTKLSINQPGDVYEQEADRVADKIVHSGSAGDITPVQRKCEHCEKEEKKAQRKETNTSQVNAGNDLENYIGNLSGSGQPLPAGVREFYEPKFGYNFSNVRIHTDTVAAKSAQSINALAYTSGNNIVFNNGQYSPADNNGKKLLAHELTHVVQQQGAQPAGKTTVQKQGLEDFGLGDWGGGGGGLSDWGNGLNDWGGGLGDWGWGGGQTPCERSSLIHYKDLICPGSNDKSTWFKLPCAWRMYKNTGECTIGVAQMDAVDNIIAIELIDPNETTEVQSVSGCNYMVVSCMPDCSGKGSVRYGPPCIS
ncbi:MAG: DUF4157 domain-containing protein [Chitinophagaceae bacterium]